MRKVTILSKIENGRFTKNNHRIMEVMNSFNGQMVTISIEKGKKKRSNQQNAYWWGVVIPVFQNALKTAGMTRTKEQTHEMIGDLVRQKYGHSPLHVEMVVNDEVFEERRGTSELTTSEFMELVSYACDFAMDVFGVEIPSPNEVENIE